MAIKKYFLDSKQVNGEWEPKYGADDLNKIVGYLRTNGVYGEIADCLKVTEETGTTVNIEDGIGWVDGCGIEATGKDTTLTLPTVSGSYSVIMKLEKDEEVVNNISFAYESGHVEADYVLAWVTVANSTATVQADKRVNSTFRGVTQYHPVYTSNAGSPINYDKLLGTGEVVTKTFSVTLGAKKVRLIFNYEYGGTKSLILGEGLNYWADGSLLDDSSGYLYIAPNGTWNYYNNNTGSAFGERVGLKSISLVGNEVNAEFYTSSDVSKSPRLNTKIYWEAW